MWSEKYRPQNITDMVGNEQSRASVVEWFAKWKPGAKPLLLCGPPGIGKTTIANIMSRQFGYDPVGLNASDVRSKSQINEVLGPVLSNANVIGMPMIFIDEVDGIHGRGDYGGASALVDVLKSPTVPIILAANNDTADKMKNIKKATKIIYFKKIPPRLLNVYLQSILKRQGVTLKQDSLTKVIDKSKGDIRSMINLAQSFVTGFDPQTEDSFEHLDVENGINSFFKAKSVEEAKGILYSMQINPRDKINAFYSSIITSSLSGDSLARHLRIMSETDMLLGRIMKTQNWRLLRYLNDTLIQLYQKDSPVRYTKYNLSWPVLNRIRWDGAKIKVLSSEMSKQMHISSSAFITLCMPFMMLCMKRKAVSLSFDESHNDIIKKEMDLVK